MIHKESPPNNDKEKVLKSTNNKSKTNLEQDYFLTELNLLFAGCESELLVEKNEEESIFYDISRENSNSNYNSYSNSNFSTNLGTSYGSLKNNLNIKKVANKNNIRAMNKNKTNSIQGLTSPIIKFESDFFIEKNSKTKCVTDNNLKEYYDTNKN